MTIKASDSDPVSFHQTRKHLKKLQTMPLCLLQTCLRIQSWTTQAFALGTLESDTLSYLEDLLLTQRPKKHHWKEAERISVTWCHSLIASWCISKFGRRWEIPTHKDCIASVSSWEPSLTLTQPIRRGGSCLPDLRDDVTSLFCQSSLTFLHCLNHLLVWDQLLVLIAAAPTPATQTWQILEPAYNLNGCSGPLPTWGGLEPYWLCFSSSSSDSPPSADGEATPAAGFPHARRAEDEPHCDDWPKEIDSTSATETEHDWMALCLQTSGSRGQRSVTMASEWISLQTSDGGRKLIFSSSEWYFLSKILIYRRHVVTWACPFTQANSWYRNCVSGSPGWFSQSQTHSVCISAPLFSSSWALPLPPSPPKEHQPPEHTHIHIGPHLQSHQQTHSPWRPTHCTLTCSSCSGVPAHWLPGGPFSPSGCLIWGQPSAERKWDPDWRFSP